MIGVSGYPLTVKHHEAPPPISFPVYYTQEIFIPDGAAIRSFQGSLFFLEGSERVDLKSSPPPHVESAIEELLNRRYPLSGRFLSFDDSAMRETPSVNTSGITAPERVGDSSDLAQALFIFLTSADMECPRRVSLTGEFLKKDGAYVIAGVKGIFDKLVSVLCYDIDVFYVPEANREEIMELLQPFFSKGFARESGNRIIIDVPQRCLEIVPVTRLEDVLTSLFGDNWYRESRFREVYDLGYRYKQEIARSNLVKIRSILGKGGKEDHAEMKGYYVKLRMVEKEEIKEKTKKAGESPGGAHQKYEELKEKKKRPPVLPVEVLKGFGAGTKKSVVIFGEAGSGKSTILRNLLHQICEEEIEEVKHLVPVFMPFGSLQNITGVLCDDIIDHLDTWTGIRSLHQSYKDYLKTLHRERQGVLFVLDALDEMTGNWQNVHEDIRALGKTLITSRYTTSAPPGELYEVMPLEKEDIKRFTEKHLHDEAQRHNFIAYIDSQSASAMIYLYSNPLMLSLALSVVRGGSGARLLDTMTRTRLINKGVTQLINGRLSAPRKENLEKAARPKKRTALEVASVFLRTAAYDGLYQPEMEERQLYEILDRVFTGSTFLDEWKNKELTVEILTSGTGILEQYREEEKNFETNRYYRFSHQVIHEYFVAQYVVNVISDDEQEFTSWINEHKFDLRYENVFRFIAGCLDMQGVDIFFSAIMGAPVDEYGSYNLILAGQCLSEVSSSRSSQEDEIVRDLADMELIRKGPVVAPVLSDLRGARDIVIYSLQKALKDPDEGVRRAATEALREIGTDRVVGHLIAALKDKGEGVRRAATEALVRIGTDRVVGHLIAALNDKGIVVRIAAAEALVRIGSDKATDAVIAALKDKEFVVRRAAAGALGRIGSDKATDAVIAALKDKEFVVRIAAAEALVRIGSNKATDAFIAALKNKDEGFDVRYRAAEALGRIGTGRVVGPLTTALKDPDEDVRRAATEALVRIGSDRVVGHLMAALKDKNEVVRILAAEALVRIGSDRVVDPLAAALKDNNKVVRILAAEALVRIGSDRVVGPLTTALKDPDEDVRRAATEALVRINSDRVLNPLAAALKDKNENVRKLAAETLVRIGSDRVVDPLRTAMKYGNKDVRSMAIYALGKINSDRVIGPLAAALRDIDGDVRKLAAEALDLIGTERVVDPLIAALKGEDDDCRIAAVYALGRISSERVVDPLIAALKDKNDDVRKLAAEALGRFNSDRVIGPLAAALNDDDYDCRIAAVYALCEIGTDRAIDPLIAALNDDDYDCRIAAVYALGRIGTDRVVDPLIATLNDDDYACRVAAVYALGRIATDRVVDPLIATLNDDDYACRVAAVYALGRIATDRVVSHPTAALKDKNDNVRKLADEALGRLNSERVLGSPAR